VIFKINNAIQGKHYIALTLLRNTLLKTLQLLYETFFLELLCFLDISSI